MGSLGNFLRRRLWRYALWTLLALVVLAAAAVGAALVLVDQAWVQARVQQRLSELAHGDIAWERLRIRLLPLPGATLTGARMEIAGTVRVLIGEADVDLRLRPLFSGQVEIARVRVEQPAVRIQLPEETAPASSQDRVDPLAVTGAVVDAIRRYAPRSEIGVEGGKVELLDGRGKAVLRLSDVSLRVEEDGEGLRIAASSASSRWSRLTANASLRFSDSRVRANAQAEGVRLQDLLDGAQAGSPVTAEVPLAGLSAKLESDARTMLACDFEVHVPDLAVRRGSRRLEVKEAKVAGRLEARKGELHVALREVRAAPYVSAGKAALSIREGGKKLEVRADVPRLDLAVARDAALAMAGDVPEVQEYVSRLRKGEATNAQVRLGGGSWEALVEPRRIHASLSVDGGEYVAPYLEQPVTAIAGQVQLAGGALAVSGVQGRLGASRITEGKLRYAWAKDSLSGDLAFDADLPQALALARDLVPKAQRASLDPLESAAGRLRGRASAELVKTRWKASAEIGGSDASLKLKPLPAPVSLAAGRVSADAKSIDIKGADASFLDARALVSARLEGYAGDALAVTASAEQGTVGDRMVAWLLELADEPERLAPATPVRFSVERLHWRTDALDAAARLAFPAGQEVSLGAAWTPKAFDVTRLHLIDKRSDATFTLHLENRRLLASFLGTLRAESVEALMKQPIDNTGSVTGDLRVRMDQRDPEQTTANGHLRMASIDLSRLLGRPTRVERLDFSADAARWTLNEALVSVDAQPLTLRGDARRGPHGLVIDAEIESAGFDLDAVLPKESGQASEAAFDLDQVDPWPLPVTGRVFLRADSVAFRGRRVAPLLASLKVERERVALDVAEANLCGLSLPLSLTATPKRYEGAISIHTKNESLDQIAHCLSGQGLVITGDVDLDVELRTQGAQGELVRNLEGTVAVQARKGRVHKFGLLANLLAYVKGQGLLEKDTPGMDREGFPYQELNVKAGIGGGKVTVDEANFLSPAIGLVATGTVGIPDGRSSLTVLVAPLGRVDRVLGKLPIIGYIFGGSILSVPVQVSGDIRDPLVVPLDPRALASRVVGIFERTFKLPGKLLMPGESAKPAPEAKPGPPQEPEY